jgi:hypothetical protein
MLTKDAVIELMTACLFKGGESTDNAVIVEGIVSTYGFHPGRIAENTEAIRLLLAELPDEFHEGKGGGWTFLNACNDRHGNQWTGFHKVMEALFALGIAAGKAKWLLSSRSVWSELPGGMPYVTVMVD